MSYKVLVEQLDEINSIVLTLFVLSIIIQLAYYLLVYLRVLLRKKGQDTLQMNEIQPVSVIICARNEAENLSQNLTSILEQDYPEFEVVVVNICSEDNTESLLSDLKQKYPHLRSTIIKKDGSFLNCKKFASKVGVRAAQYEWLLFTDADCKPENSRWIATMNRYFVENKDIVLGYGGYMAQKGYMNKLIRYDSCFTALRYFGFAILGNAYMGVERNLAYRKSLFFEHKGFAENAHIISGDNDLFVNKAAKKRNVAVALINNAYTRSIQNNTFKEWFWQKSKQMTSSKYYKNSQVFLLTLELVSQAIMWLSFGVLIIICPFWQYVLLTFMLRMIIFITIIGIAVKKFNEPDILKHAVFFDIFMPFLNFYIFLLNRISSKHLKWK